MITRCLLHNHHVFIAHRGFCTSRPSSSIIQNVKRFLTAVSRFPQERTCNIPVFKDDRENFDEENIRKAHKKDKLDEKEWTLIYRDIGASRTFYMTAIFLPCFIVGAAIFTVDVNTNSAGNRLGFVQKLLADADELGVLIAVPSVALAVVVAFLVRVQQLRLMRIYQNRKNVEKFIAIRSKGVVTQYKVCESIGILKLLIPGTVPSRRVDRFLLCRRSSRRRASSAALSLWQHPNREPKVHGDGRHVPGEQLPVVHAKWDECSP